MGQNPTLPSIERVYAMKMKRMPGIIRLTLVFCLLLYSTGLPAAYGEGSSSPAPQTPGNTADRSMVLATQADPAADVENLFFLQEDFVIQGVTNRQDYYFELTQSRKLQKGSYFQLYYGHSPTLLPHKSTITVFLDDIPLGSKFLNEENLENASWKIEFPDTDLKPGFHKISILTHMEASSNLCEDQNNAANWTLFHKESIIHLSFRKTYDRPGLEHYPSPFLEAGSAAPLKTLFVMPDNPDEGQLMALARLSAYFAGLMPSALMEFKVVRESDAAGDLLKSSHQIWIGNGKSWTGEGNRLMQGVQEGGAPADGTVRLLASPWNPAHTSMWIGGDAEQLKRAADALTNKSFYGQLTGGILDVRTESGIMPAAAAPVKAKNKVTLSDMGYSDLIIESPLVGAARVNYVIPAEWDVYKGAKFKIQFNHTKTLNFAQSLMTVKVNNTPLSSKYLTEETSDFGALEVDIPQDLLQTGAITLDIGFQFSSSKESCAGNSQIGNWSVISKNSSLSFSYRPNRTVDFGSLPYPFVTGSAWNPTVLYTEAHPSSEVLSLLASVCGDIGKTAASADGLEIVKAPALPASGKNIIYIGRTGGLPDVLNRSTAIPVQAEGTALIPRNPKVSLARSNSERTGVMQLFRLPDTSNFALVMAGGDNEVLKRMNKQLHTTAERNKMTGQVILIDPVNRVHAFSIEQAADGPGTLEKALDLLAPDNKNVQSRFYIILGAVGVLLLVTVTVWLARRRRR